MYVRPHTNKDFYFTQKRLSRCIRTLPAEQYHKWALLFDLHQEHETCFTGRTDRKPQAVAQANCCDPAVSHNNHERLQYRFIQQKASDVCFHSAACSRPQLSDWEITPSGASVACSKTLAGKCESLEFAAKCDFYITGPLNDCGQTNSQK